MRFGEVFGKGSFVVVEVREMTAPYGSESATVDAAKVVGKCRVIIGPDGFRLDSTVLGLFKPGVSEFGVGGWGVECEDVE